MKALSLKSIVRSSPQLYDFYLRERRRFSEETDPLAEMLGRFSQARGGAVRFIAAGAGNGLDNDPLREFILREDWRGVLVEPEPLLFRSLMRNYPGRRFPHIRLVPAALSARDDEALLLYAVKPEAVAALEPEQRTAVLAAASLERDRLLARLSGQGLGPDSVLPRETQAVTLMGLARAFYADRHFDLLLLDAGGHEAAILGSLDLEVLRPDMILLRDGGCLGERQPALTQKLVRAGYAVRPFAGTLLASLV
jgi:FkbM family methyltransferase